MMRNEEQTSRMEQAANLLTRGGRQNRRRLNMPAATVIVAAAFSIIQLGSLLSHCQGFEDLNNNNNNKHNTFQPQHPAAPIQRTQSGAATRHSFQRPVLSNRFAASTVQQQQQQQQPQLAAQASSSATTFSEPPASLSGGQQQQQPAPVSNIEQMMKNALARTAQLNSAAESRADREPQAETVAEAAAPRELSSRLQQRQQQQQETTQAASSTQPDKQSEASETRSTSSDAAATTQEEAEKQTTAAGPTTTASGHETVYSDQRFANLFARRNQLKKSRLQPQEQVKAKPTLPSFIKSLPDPKQFSASPANGQDRPANGPSGGASNSFASQRVQQQQQQLGRLQAGQQKKQPIITSTSAANANNKRATSLANGGQKLGSSSTTPKARAATGTTSRPAGNSNNPFSRSPASGGNSDPANVIAMARKRLLANNALESAKLKQQSNKQQTTN